MKDRPAYLPLYVRDFWTDPKVLAMAWLEQAIYLRMLMLSWEAGPLPDDPHLIERMIGLGADVRISSQADGIQLVLEGCWVHGEIGWTNPRLEKERSRWREQQIERSERATCAANKRWGNAKAMLEQCVGNAGALLGDANPQAQAQVKEPPKPPTGGRGARAPRLRHHPGPEAQPDPASRRGYCQHCCSEQPDMETHAASCSVRLERFNGKASLPGGERSDP